MNLEALSVPIAHIDDADSTDQLIRTLETIHGPEYGFALGRWAGETQWEPVPERLIVRFIVASDHASASLQPGDTVGGPLGIEGYRPVDEHVSAVDTELTEELWPGDVICLDDGIEHGMTVTGFGVYFEVSTPRTGYHVARLSLLRYLPDFPGGCAAYPGAFRREALPPDRNNTDCPDPRGVNRVNEHTLDMRIDRDPPPIRHYHGAISVGDGQIVNHSETAIVLPRSIYNLPEVGEVDQGHILIYRRPAQDPTDTVIIPVRPGSIVITPATSENVMGHAFENCFAMLVAIPGFVAPYNFVE